MRSTGSADHLEWRQTDGNGTIYSNAVVHDTRIAALQPDQPLQLRRRRLGQLPRHQLPVPRARHGGP